MCATRKFDSRRRPQLQMFRSRAGQGVAYIIVDWDDSLVCFHYDPKCVCVCVCVCACAFVQ